MIPSLRITGVRIKLLIQFPMGEEVFLAGNLETGNRLVLDSVKQRKAGWGAIPVERVPEQIDRRQVCPDRTEVLIKDQGLQAFVGNGQVSVEENEIVKLGQGIAHRDRINTRGGRRGEVAIADGSGYHDGLVKVIDAVSIDQAFDRVSQGRIGFRGAPELIVGGHHQFAPHDLKLHWQRLGRKPMRVPVLPRQYANRPGLFERHDRTIEVD